ncbi:MAG TPA: CPBP family intramembrane glutamic endopeptidase [Rhizomicrobium sp.]|nr:CPBP family intramembrane glutamic endopeptidase [Rhizomicrobium sp.]
MTEVNRRRLLIAVGLLLSLGLALLPLGPWGRTYSGLGRLLGGEVLWWIAVAVVLLYVLLVERRSVASIGLRRPKLWDLVPAVIAGLLLVAGIIVIYQIVFPLLHLAMNVHEMKALRDTPFWYRFLLVTRAAVAEELLFRGYPIERLKEWSGSTALAAVISWAAFTYAHLGTWGPAQLIVAGYGGVVLTVLYLWRRNLPANMLAHWIADGAGFLL